MSSGHKVPPVRTWSGFAQNPPLGHRADVDSRRRELIQSLGQVFARGQFRVTEGPFRGRVKELAVADLDRDCIDIPAPAGKLSQQLSRRGSPLTHGRHGPRGRAAPRCDAVIGHQTGIGHDQTDLAQGDTQFLSRSLA